MEESGQGSVPERFREAAQRARDELLTQLGREAERLDHELAELSVQMMNTARSVAAERVDRELERLDETG